MKKHPFSLLLFVLFVACDFSWEINSGTETEKARNHIEKTLDNWHQAASDADFEAYFKLLDTDAVFVGTDASEVWNKKEFMQFAKPYFDKGRAWHFTKINRHIYFDELHSGMAWFDETLDTWMGICRGSGVVVKKNNQWLLKHYVLSLTVPNDKMNKVMQIIN